MSGITCATHASLQSAVGQDGFAFVHASAMREILGPFGSWSDWQRFADSWNDLRVDTYMADGGRYRRRRHAVYLAGETVDRAPHQPHYQALDYNPLNGGIARWFEPIAPDVADGPTMRTILTFCRSLFDSVAPATRRWRAEVHQFRIEARAGEEGRPTPEGLHRDGVDYVLVLLVQRQNIASGTTTIHGRHGEQLGDFTLIEPFDAALLDDRRVRHGVTPVRALDPAAPAHRDVLVVTFVADGRAMDATRGFGHNDAMESQ
jgi:hypothetical protein